MYSLKNLFRNIFGYPEPKQTCVPLEFLSGAVDLWNDLAAAKEKLLTAHQWVKDGHATEDSIIGRAAEAYEILDKWVK